MKKRVETSKLIVTVISAALLCVSAFACALMWRTGDTGALTVLLGAWGVDGAAAYAFYFDKAKAENEIKLTQSAEIDALRAEIEALRGELPKPKAPRKKQPENDLAGQMRVLLEQYASDL